MDNRRTPVLLAFVVGYFFIVAVLLFLIPHLGVQIIYAVLAVWIVLVLAIALFAGRRRKGLMPKASKTSPQKKHDLFPEAIRI
jgi:hypothetical protein